MSTLNSTHMNVSRSSTRRHAPPGGASSIDFGGYALPTAPAAATAPAVAAAPVAAAHVAPPAPTLDIEPATQITKSNNGAKENQVGVAIVSGVGSDAFVEAVKHSFAEAGLTRLLFMSVADTAILPFAAQNLLSVCEVVVAGAVLSEDSIGVSTGGLSQALVASLTQLGLISSSCVVPAIVNRGSLLEAKAILPSLATNWASLCNAALSIKQGTVSVHVAETAPAPATPVITTAVASVDDLLAAFTASLKARGAYGINGIARKFRIADDDNSGTLSQAEFNKMIAEHTLGWTTAQTKSMFDHFDKDKSGTIVFDEFLVGIRGQLNDRRRQLVYMAFQILDADKSGVIEINDIKAKYNASKHPDVITHKRTEDEVLREFLDTFDGPVKDGKIDFSEFCNYYSNVSSSIDNDDYFELMIRNAWHISGGEGWCANSSCRRVLVIHTDGRQTVEEIKNDLGIGANDKEAMLANLAEQGITDVASIDTTGNADNTTTVAPPSPTKAASGDVAAGGIAVARQHRKIKGGEASIVLG